MWQFQTLNLNLRSYVSESGGTGIAIQMVPVEHAQVDRGVGVLGIVHMLAPVHHQYMHGIKVRATSCPTDATASPGPAPETKKPGYDHAIPQIANGTA